MTAGTARRTRIELAALVVAVVGVAIRLQLFVAGRSLWLDEAMLATNVTHRSFGRLLEPLANAQGAPVLFLWAERAAVVVLGDGERQLRLLPMLAGVAVVPLTWAIGRRLLGSQVALAALTLVALSPALIRYSNEVKQYSTDAAVALGLVALTLAVLDGRPRTLRWLGAAGALAPWLSHPAAFVAAGCGVALAVRPVRRRHRTEVSRLVGVAAVWSASLALEYVVSLRELGDDDALRSYWRDGFAPDGGGVAGTARWLGAATARFADDSLGTRFGMLALALGLVGLVVLARRRPAGLAVAAPLPFLILAAMLGLFPFQGRVVLFAVPLVWLVVAAAVAAPAGWPRRLAAVGVAACAVAPVVTTADRLVDPLPFPEAREMLRYVRDHRQAGDGLWLVAPATPPYQHYAVRFGLQARVQLDWRNDAAACEPLGGAGRVWVVHAYTYGGRPGATGRRVRSHLDAEARRLDLAVGVDASATLYDFDATPTDPDGQRIDRRDGRACLSGSPLAPVGASGLRTGPFGTGSRT